MISSHKFLCPFSFEMLRVMSLLDLLVYIWGAIVCLNQNTCDLGFSPQLSMVIVSHSTFVTERVDKAGGLGISIFSFLLLTSSFASLTVKYY